MKNKKLKVHRIGFTLIELLVVISIIGILASLALVSYGGAQKQSRDTRRKSDLQQYRNALEGYAGANGGKYPAFTGATGDITLMPVTSSLCSSDYLYPFMSDTCLTDPKPSGDNCNNANNYIYCYAENGGEGVSGAGATEYLLYAKLETGGFWVICSNGKVGKVNTKPTNSSCPSTL